VRIQGCAHQVSYQVLNKNLCVDYLIDAIESENAGLQAALANVEDDTSIGGERENFERVFSAQRPGHQKEEYSFEALFSRHL